MRKINGKQPKKRKKDLKKKRKERQNNKIHQPSDKIINKFSIFDL